MFTVEHNPDALVCAKRIIVRNMRKAKDTIRELMDIKRPRGMRLRHNYDTLANAIYLEAYSLVPITCALSALRESGNIVAIDNQRMRQV